MYTAIGIDASDWIGAQDNDGLPFFTEDAFECFLESAVQAWTSDMDGALDSETYQAAREQLWAVREDLG